MKPHALLIISILGMMIFGMAYQVSLLAEAPQSIAYQAIVRDSDGTVISDQQVSFQITLHKDDADGPEVYCETHTATTSPLGLVTLEIGNGTPVFGSFQVIEWSTGVYFLEVEMDPEGGTDYVALGTTQLLSVPYALYSEKTGQTYQAGSGIDITDEVIINTAPNAYHYGDAEGSDALVVSGIQGKPVSPAEPVMDQVLQWDGSQWNPATLAGASPGWSLTGNSGTDPEVNFLGTTDNQPLRFKVNGQPAGEINPINENTFLGWQAGEYSGGMYNVGLGSGALANNTDRSELVAIGVGALNNNGLEATESCHGTRNTAIGFHALNNNTTGYSNTAIGWCALFSNTSGKQLVASGTFALFNNITGNNNTAHGYASLYSNIEGSNNTVCGHSALSSNESGDNNVAIGLYALGSNISGDRNTALGKSAGYTNMIGSGNVFIGYVAGCNETGSNKLYIANDDEDPPLIYGDFSTGEIGLGTITPQSKIHIVGEDNVRMILSSADGVNDLASELMMKGTFSEPIPDHLSRNIAMVKAYYDAGGWDKATLAFHVAGADCNTDGGTDPCERMRITSDGHVGIGTENPHWSAILDVASSNMGFLPPRMTQSQRTAISSPAAGLLVYQTDAPSGYYYYTGSGWVSIEGTGAGSPSSCIDYDGNAYPTFTIGTQVWMAENLRVTHYRNGDPIPNVTGDTEWTELTTGAYCWYDNDEGENAKYGALYNWYAVEDSRGLCPEGWHVPTTAEWETLRQYLGGYSYAGSKMKSVSTLWDDPNTDATNNSGFSGLPGGYRFFSDGDFHELGTHGNFWSSTYYEGGQVDYIILRYNYANMYLMGCNPCRTYGHSSRCIKDE